MLTSFTLTPTLMGQHQHGNNKIVKSEDLENK